MLENDTWIQCDNTNCLKWRRIAAEKAAAFSKDKEWLCCMNQDYKYNSCQVEQEDFHKWEKLAKTHGLKYVPSTLELGLLVWAKVTGYCWWPAIVTRDFIGGEYVDFDDDGEPLWYHMEYLGQNHSHGWVETHNIQVYGKSLQSPSASSHRMKKRKKKLGLGGCSQKRRYQNAIVEDAICEANSLLCLTYKDRLMDSRLSYHSNSPMPQKQEKDQMVLTNELKEETSSDGSVDKTCMRKTSKPWQNTLPQKSCLLLPTKKKTGTTATFDPELSFKTCEGKHLMGSSAKKTCSSGKLQHEIDFHIPLTGKTKEEKLALDIEMYCKNKTAFEHDVTRFMIRNGLHLRRPTWQGVHIDLFQVFLAVHDRGGFKQVHHNNGGWSGIHKELTGVGGQGNLVKIFYTNNLLPYEEYMKGNRVSSLVNDIKGRRKKKSKQKRKIAYAMETEDSVTDAPAVVTEAEVLALMAEMDEYDEQCTFHYPSEDLLQSKGINIAFPNDSPAMKKVPNFQEIPSFMSEFHVGDATIDYATQYMPTDMGEMSNTHSGQLYHEMKALEQELDAYDRLIMI